MTLGVRGKLFLVSFVLVVAVGATSAVYLESALGERVRVRAQVELLQVARVSRATLESTPADQLDVAADRLGRATDLRFTLVDPSGRVLGDSTLEAEALARAPSLADRPEIAAALRGRDGLRADDEMLYVALPADGYVVRAGRPLRAIEAEIDDIQLLLLAAAALGLVAALLMSAVASYLLARPVRALLVEARRFAESGEPHVGGRRPDELSSLASSLNQLGTALRDEVTTLAGERDRMEAVLEGIGEAVIAVDGERRVTLVNRAGLELLRLKRSPLGRPLLEAIRSPELHDAIAPALAGQPMQLDLELPGDPVRHLMARITPLRSSTGAVAVMHDVTRLRRLETIRRDFVANVSHELRTPVTVLRANAETLLAGAMEDPERARSFLSAILRNAERLSQLVADLLDITRIESGKYAMSMARVALGPVVGRALDTVDRLAEEKDMRISVDLADEATVRGDEKALEQVMINLISNAVKYTQAGGHVAIWAREQSGRMRIEVRDDGPGIAAEHRERVFERFYRVDSGRSKAMGGTGLGLAIVKHLIAAMGGTVGVQPNMPRGTVFFVELPASGVEDEQAAA